MSREKWITRDESIIKFRTERTAYIAEKIKEGFGKYCELCGTDLPHPSLFDDDFLWMLDEKMTYCKHCNKKINGHPLDDGSSSAAYVLAWTALIFFYGFHTQSNFIL